MTLRTYLIRFSVESQRNPTDVVVRAHRSHIVGDAVIFLVDKDPRPTFVVPLEDVATMHDVSHLESYAAASGNYALRPREGEMDLHAECRPRDKYTGLDISNRGDGARTFPPPINYLPEEFPAAHCMGERSNTG